MERRQFLKYMGAAAVTTGAVAATVTGYKNGVSPMTHSGWEKEAFEEGQHFDRTPYEVDHPPFRKVGPTRRVEVYADTQTRRAVFRSAFDVPGMAAQEGPGNAFAGPGGAENEAFAKWLATQVDVKNLAATPYSILKDQGLAAWYQENLEREGWNIFAEDLRYYLEVLPRYARIQKEAEYDFALSQAYFGATALHMGYHASLTAAKDSDFARVNPKRYEVKDPAEMTRLIKKIGHMFGSPIVRIVEVNPDWSYERHVGGRGYRRGEPVDIPAHWKYGIMLASPLSWDTLYASPTMSSSIEGYSMVGTYAAKMAAYVKNLGYPARSNDPQSRYEFIMPPHAVACGMGEQGRNGICVTPEFGANFRPAMVVTNLPLVPDKPIDAGIRKFCMSCKICAESCPTRSISFDGPKEINGRGYDGWQINASTCHSGWMSTPTNGCRVCMAVCPFSKKSNWLHTSARNVAINDPTSLTPTALTAMERAIYGTHDGEYYHYEDGSRIHHTVKEMPWFFKSADFIKE